MRGVSTYERYDRDHAIAYAEARKAVGAEIIAGCLTETLRPLHEIELLDAGCGTGVYAAVMVNKVGYLAALDASEAMLSVAKSRLLDAARIGRVSFHHGDIEQLPFPDHSFDGVMVNQVLHHLEDGSDCTHRAHARAIAETFRVLRPGGVLVLNACTHDQIRKGFWYYDLIPEARERSLRVGATQSELEEMLTSCGFQLQERIVALEGVMQGERYFEPEGPLDPEWRRLDSIWALATAEEIARAEARVRELAHHRQLRDFAQERDAARRRTGQFTFFMARRPGGRCHA